MRTRESKQRTFTCNKFQPTQHGSEKRALNVPHMAHMITTYRTSVHNTNNSPQREVAAHERENEYDQPDFGDRRYTLT